MIYVRIGTNGIGLQMSLKGDTRMWIDPKRKAEELKEKAAREKDLEKRVRMKLIARRLEELDAKAKENTRILEEKYAKKEKRKREGRKKSE
jgi:hypothetical protein